MTVIGFDYTERIPPAALLAAGCSVVIRYTTWSGWAKSLTPNEADELHAAGIPVVANFESTGDRMKGGAAAGRADALEVVGHLRDDHLPTDLKVWFSADWDVQPSEVALVLAYLSAAASVLGGVQKVGLYGGLRAVKAAADAGFAIWQTVAWSGGVWDPRAVARQTGAEQTVGGVRVDVNEIENLAGLGAWGGPAPAPGPTPTTASDPEDDMPTFATGEIKPGDGEVTLVLPPPANRGTAGWGNVWFSLAATDADASVHVVGYVDGEGYSHDYPNVTVPDHGSRINPFGGPLPAGIQKISVTRTGPSHPDVPLSWLIEATHR